MEGIGRVGRSFAVFFYFHTSVLCSICPSLYSYICMPMGTYLGVSGASVHLCMSANISVYPSVCFCVSQYIHKPVSMS